MARLAPALAAFLLALSACSPDAAPPANEQSAVAPAAGASASLNLSDTAAEAGAAAGSDDSLEAAAAPAGPAASGPRTARRCGWLHNPTPGNWWLEDRDGRWVLATQGQDGAPGMDEMPDMSEAGWEKTNGHYGHGCACLTLTVEGGSGKVLRIASPTPLPLEQCRGDRALPPPGEAPAP